MKWPFKFLPTLPVDHDNKSVFNAMRVEEDKAFETLDYYYEKVGEAIESGELKNIEAIPESFVLKTLMNREYGSLNEMITCVAKIYHTTAKGNAFDPNVAQRVLGFKMTQKLVSQGILASLDKIPLPAAEKERMRDLMNITEDPELMDSLPKDEQLSIIRELIALKGKVVEEGHKRGYDV